MRSASHDALAVSAITNDTLRGAVDFGFRTAYKVAHRMLRAYWSVRNPHTRGALVAVWHDDELLMVKNSYRREYTLPGGYIRSGERATEAARRELREEVGIDVPLHQIEQAYNGVKPYENRQDEVTIVEVTVKDRPSIEVDNREVVWAGFKPPSEILTLPIIPHLREWLEDRLSQRSP